MRKAPRVFALACLLAGCASNAPQESIEAPALNALLADANLNAKRHEYAIAAAKFRRATDARAFAALPTGDQYRALVNAASTEVRLEQPGQAYRYLARADRLPEATFESRLDEVRFAAFLHLHRESVAALMALLADMPDRIAQLEADTVFSVTQSAAKLGNPTKLQLLRSLYASHWTLPGGIEPSSYWRDLCLELLLANDPAAYQVAQRIVDPVELATMRIDKRYDRLTLAHPELFDIGAAAERERQLLESAADEHPKLLRLKLDLMNSLSRQHRFPAMLALADATLTEVKSTNFPTRLYSDYWDYYNWLLDARADALQRMGRWEEAVSQMHEASLVREGSNANVSQVINLAELYNRVSQPHEALATLQAMDGSMSVYGHMEFELAKLQAALQLEDAAQSERSLKYLADHRADGPRLFLSALVAAHQQDRAARYLGELLNDPDARAQALLSVQDFAEHRDTPRGLQQRADFMALAARKDVQDAVARVGRIEHFSISEY